MSLKPPDLPPGLAARFVLRARLGSGSFSEVYEVFDRDAHQVRALKLQTARQAHDPTIQARFAREAEVTQKVQGPGIVQVYGFGQEAGRSFLVLEYLEGSDFSAWAKAYRDQADFSRRWAECFLQALEALGRAHAQGVVHRDLKPENLRIQKDGSLKILDFGLGKSEASQDMTRKGAFLGSLFYAAPEVMEGNPADPAGDLYALGCLGLELLLGEPPLQAPDPMQLYRAKREGFYRSEMLQGSGLSGAWDQAFRGLLDPDPGKRPKDGLALLAALREAGIPQRSAAKGPESSPRAAKPVAKELKSSKVTGPEGESRESAAARPVPTWAWALLLGMGLAFVGVLALVLL